MAVVTAVLSMSLKCIALMQFPLPAQNALRYILKTTKCGWHVGNLKAAARSWLKRLRDSIACFPFCLAVYLPYSSSHELT